MKTNWYGFYAYFKREFLRFFKVPNSTIFPQLITVLFYFLIFGIAIGSRIQEVAGVSFFTFIFPGLFVNMLINGAYYNPSGSIFMARTWGSINDILTAPVSYTQFIFAHVFAAFLRGMFLALGTVAIAAFFIPITILHWFIFISYILLISLVFSLFGIVIGLWAKEFESLNIFLNFVITPLTFLGGIFYTLDMVPTAIATITKLNPVFYMINGVRYGMIGVQDGSVYFGLILLGALSIIMFFVVWHLVKKGYNLRT